MPPKVPFGLKLSPIRQRIVEEVQRVGRHGILSDVLFEKIYGHRSDGGPDTWTKCLSAHIVHLNRQLKQTGCRIKGFDLPGRTAGAHVRYRLEQL